MELESNGRILSQEMLAREDGFLALELYRFQRAAVNALRLAVLDQEWQRVRLITDALNAAFANKRPERP